MFTPGFNHCGLDMSNNCLKHALEMNAPAPQSAASTATRTALIEAAIAVFGEAGFKNATVRDICQRAGANVAAVNYHFGDKESLYLAVLRQVQQQADARHPLPQPRGAARPERRLELFVESFLLRLLDPGPNAAGSKLMSREMVDPSAVFDAVLVEQVQPIADEVRGIVTELLGRGATEEAIRMCGLSLVSQCHFYHQCRGVVLGLFPDFDLGSRGVAQLARHITRFSLAGIRAIGRRKGAPGTVARSPSVTIPKVMH
jgi:AcrR family transcriptional regulator